MKYVRTFLLALQSEFISRANIVGWFIVGAIPSVILALVWLAILGDKQSINGFTKGDFVLYYLFVTFSWYIVGGNFAFPVGNGIKDGRINMTLLKPYNVVFGLCIQEQAWKALSFIIALPFALIVLYLFRDDIHIKLTLIQNVMLFISLILGAIIFAFLEALAGISAFWVTEMWPIAHVNGMLFSLFGGRMLPLTLMPPVILFIANLLPYKYIFHIPVSILLSKSSNMYLDIGLQFLYICILALIYQFVWIKGIQKYEAIGS